MPYIPLKYEEEFSNLFKTVTIAIEDKDIDTKFRQVLKEDEIIEALNKKEPEPLHLELAINSLSKMNIRNILVDLKKFLISKDKEDFVKVLILVEMVKQNIDEEIKLLKDGKTISLKPSEIDIFEEMKSLAYISRVIEDQLFSDQTQLLIALGIMQTYLLFVYPQEVKPDEYDIVAGVCHYMSAVYLRKEESIEFIQESYKITDQKEFLKTMEKIQVHLDKRQTSFQ
jgi:hypothetical protein